MDSAPLEALVELFAALDAHGVRYCHWKSNLHLDRSVRGLTDLDLLVDRQQSDRFRAVLSRHSVKPMLSSPEQRYPAMEDYLGFDADTGRLFHLHVHYRLVLGEQFVKNYRLPLERAFLDSAQCREKGEGGARLPAPEVELAVLAVRALLKYRDRDVVKDVLSIRSPGIPAAILQEVESLRSQVEGVSAVAEVVGDGPLAEVVAGFLNTVADSPRSGYVLCRLRRRLRRALRPHQIHGRLWAVGRYWSVLWRRRLFPGCRRGKRLFTGGVAVAVVGADGAGKSTLVRVLDEWLSWKLDVRRYYMGSQEPSLLSRLLHAVLWTVGKAYRAWSLLVGERRASGGVLDRWRRMCRNVHHLSIARDRYRRYLVSRRAVSQGAVVLYDRYPLEPIHRVMEHRPMDGPQIAAESGERAGRVTRFLARVEQDVYRRIRPPDCVLVLRVSPEVSQQRKPDHSRAMVEAKSRALEQMDRRGLYVVEIDADQPFDQVVLQAKRALWSVL